MFDRTINTFLVLPLIEMSSFLVSFLASTPVCHYSYHTVFCQQKQQQQNTTHKEYELIHDCTQHYRIFSK